MLTHQIVMATFTLTVTMISRSDATSEGRTWPIATNVAKTLMKMETSLEDTGTFGTFHDFRSIGPNNHACCFSPLVRCWKMFTYSRFQLTSAKNGVHLDDFSGEDSSYCTLWGTHHMEVDGVTIV